MKNKITNWVKENKIILIVFFAIIAIIFTQKQTESRYRICMNQARLDATKSIEYEKETRHFERYIVYFDDAFEECIKGSDFDSNM